jgi:hypothetical protein
LKLLIQTQVYENYGAHDWDGTGACPQYWKAKGGMDYVVRDVGVQDLDSVVRFATEQVEQANDYYTEAVIDWRVVADSYLTEFEQSQLDYEGKITFPATEILVDSSTV